MLHPEERHSLTEALRPPPGWKLDQALGTTYTLDLMTLLSVPLSFTFFDIEDSAGKPIADPIRIMEALRRYAHRVHVFSQSGRIAFSKPNRLLNVFIENSVHAVKASRAGVFHPKMWALRFIDADHRVMYRLLCSSRNLTFDRSWDTIVCLEGLVQDRRNAYSINHPLGDFIKALPDLCVYRLGRETRKVIESIQYELRRTVFETPEGLVLSGFHPLGITDEHPPGIVGPATALTVVSPFVSKRLLDSIVADKQQSYLLSRRESLDELPEDTLAAFTNVYVMDQTVETEMHKDDEEEEGPEGLLAGLHAKCFVVERGHRSTIYSGSANATSAAFGSNVEMLVALEGGKWNFGSSAIFGTAEKPSDFMKLLRPYVRTGAQSLPDSLNAEFEALRDAVINALSDTSLDAFCSSESDGTYALTLRGNIRMKRVLTSGGELSARPLSLGSQFSVPVNTDTVLFLTFPGVSFEAITSFFVFELCWIVGDREFLHRFVINVPLSGAPEDRAARVMGLLLKDERQVMRLLLMILGIVDPTEVARQTGPPIVDPGLAPFIHGSTTQPLFELLVRAASRYPEKIEDIDRIVTWLRKAENGARLLPEGFDDIWLPIREAAREGKRK